MLSFVSRYLCEVMGTSEPNLLMEEAALMAMMESQAEIRWGNVAITCDNYNLILSTGQPWGPAWPQRRASGESEDQLLTLTGLSVRLLRWKRSALPSFPTAKYPGLTFSGCMIWKGCIMNVLCALWKWLSSNPSYLQSFFNTNKHLLGFTRNRSNPFAVFQCLMECDQKSKIPIVINKVQIPHYP